MAHYIFNFELQNKILSIVLLRPRLLSGLVWLVVVIACLSYSQDKKPKTAPKMICSNKEKNIQSYKSRTWKQALRGALHRT